MAQGQKRAGLGSRIGRRDLNRPPHVGPEATPVYTDDGRIVSWRRSEKESEEFDRELAQLKLEPEDWINELKIDGLYDDRIHQLHGQELLDYMKENYPDKIVDEPTARIQAYRREQRNDRHNRRDDPQVVT